MQAETPEEPGSFLERDVDAEQPSSNTPRM